MRIERTKILVILAIFVLSTTAFAQKQYTISGYIKDATNSEDLIGATIFIANHNKGTTTNGYGFYSLSTYPDSVDILISYIGYLTQTKKILLNQDFTYTYNLEPETNQIGEVEIKGENYYQNINSTQMSVNSLTAKEAKTIPLIFGEVDMLKVLQLKPGIQNPGEGFSGLYVRGGSTDQNLFLIDEATVYNPMHVGGFFSIFNSDAVKNIDLYKGGFPAQYGGRISSIVDVKMRDGNKQKFSGSGGIGLISSRLSLEGPIKKGKGSYIISARRTYFDIFTNIYNKTQENVKDYQPIPAYYFYDLNVKLNYEVSPKDRIFLSGYLGRDVLGFSNKRVNFDFDWGNIVGTLRWNRIFSPKLFANLSLISSDYRYNITNNINILKFSIGSTVSDYSIKYDFDYQPNTKHSIKFGAQYTFHHFVLGRLNITSTDNTINFNNENKANAQSFAGYISDDIDISPRLKVNAGMRISGFVNNQDKQLYIGLEPRIATRFKLSQNLSWKSSYARMNQYVNLISNTGASLPWDFWYPSSKTVKPQISDQIATGLSTTFGDGKYMLSGEFFYKWMQNQIDFRDGAQIFLNDQLEQEFVFGRGWAYGSELYLEKKEGKLRGWIGYTLQWNNRQFDAINNGKAFSARFDRRHDISVVATYDITPRLLVSCTFVYGTGNVITLPIGRIYVQDTPGSTPLPIPEYGDRNTFRMDAYHRMDFGLIYKFAHKWGVSDLSFSVYNVYNQRNPFFIYFDELKTDSDITVGFQAKQVSLFPIIPAVTWNFKF